MPSAVVCVAVALLFLSGCEEPKSTTTSSKSRQGQRRSDRGEILLRNAAGQLSNLPSAVDTEVRPPVVVMDSSKRRDGQDMYAVAIRRSNDPEAPINIVTVPSGNAGFRNSFNVASGDILKLYIVPDDTLDEERRKAGLARNTAMDFTISQVLDDNSLLLEKGIPPAVADRYVAEIGAENALPEAGVTGMLVPAKLEIWRNEDFRVRDIDGRLGRYKERRIPAIGWEPGPDEQSINQMVAWLNQWLRQSGAKVEWNADAKSTLLDTLDPALAGNKELAPYISAEALASDSFQQGRILTSQSGSAEEKALDRADGRLLQEAAWLRDIARWAQGKNFNELDRATALFDWTVRNVQLEADANGQPRRPWQTLLYGRGTADQRAWVFAMLARQQGMDVVMINAAPADKPAYWLAAVPIDKELYLFDPHLGLPIPGPEGKGVATLGQVQADDALLRQLDLDGETYVVTAAALKDAVPFVVADEFSLSKRARQLESKLTGEDQLTLTSRPGEVAERLKAVDGLPAAKLWDVPFRTLEGQLTLGPPERRLIEALLFQPFALKPLLWKARAHHFQGHREASSEPMGRGTDDHRAALQLYQQVRPTDRDIAASGTELERTVREAAKRDATYWIGLLAFDDGKYDVAAHWLGLEPINTETSPWRDGARYNLARTLEAQGKLDEAAALLEKDPKSPQAHGDRVRAKRLREQAAEKE